MSYDQFILPFYWYWFLISSVALDSILSGVRVNLIVFERKRTLTLSIIEWQYTDAHAKLIVHSSSSPLFKSPTRAWLLEPNLHVWQPTSAPWWWMFNRIDFLFPAQQSRGVPPLFTVRGRNSLFSFLRGFWHRFTKTSSHPRSTTYCNTSHRYLIGIRLGGERVKHKCARLTDSRFLICCVLTRYSLRVILHPEKPSHPSF